MIKANTGKHEMQAPHTAEECRQNDSIHAHPDTACEHPVMSGPGVQIGKDAVTGPGIGI